jgi:predicted amidohydrolase YtcJ
MDAARPTASAAVIVDGVFEYVGDANVINKLFGGYPYDSCQHEIVDAKGADVVPGFNDSHMHALHCAGLNDIVSLHDAGSIEESLARMESAKHRRADGWIVAEGWNQDRFDERRPLTKDDLDSVSDSIPIVATRVCGHVATANTAALRMAGLSGHDGVLREGECGLVKNLIPAPDLETQCGRLVAFQERLFEKGVTSIQSDDLGWIPDGQAERYINTIAFLSNSGELAVRYALQASLGDTGSALQFFEAGSHEIHGKRFKVSHQKLFADGSLGARTAWLHQPYTDAPNDSGIAVMDIGDMNARVELAAKYGVPSAIHVIGDAAFSQALCTLGGTWYGSSHALNHALVHAQITNWDQIREAGSRGLNILAQPVFLRTDAPIVRDRVGDRADSSYRWRTMLGAGATVAFSTDSPVEPFDPMLNMYCAITRHGPDSTEPYLPDEAFTLDEALYAYTAAGARVSGESGLKGRIAHGQLADFVILDGKLNPNDPRALLTTGVRETFISGKSVWKKL